MKYNKRQAWLEEKLGKTTEKEDKEDQDDEDQDEEDQEE